jgi:hypothetical protein
MNDLSPSLAVARPLPEATRATRVLVPFDRREALTLRQAAEIAGRSETTVRKWAAFCDLGRRIGAGHWAVSRVALAMSSTTTSTP